MTDKHKLGVLKAQYADLLDRYLITLDALEDIANGVDHFVRDDIQIASRALERIRRIVANG